MEDTHNYYIQIVVCGEQYLFGKTSAVADYLESFTEAHQVTLGVNFLLANFHKGNSTIKLRFWDMLACGGRFSTISSSLYRSSNGIIVFCDGTNPSTLIKAENFILEAKRVTHERHPPPPIMILCKTKKNSKCKEQVKHGQALASEHDTSFFQVSTKAALGSAMDSFVEHIVQRKKAEPPEAPIANDHTNNSSIAQIVPTLCNLF